MMNKQYLFLAVLLGLLQSQYAFGAAGSKYPVSSPLFNAAVAIDADFNGKFFWGLEGFKETTNLDSTYTKGTKSFPMLITLMGRNWEKPNRTVHIGIGAHDQDWGMSYEETSIMPLEDIKIVHKTIKGLIKKHDVAALDSMAAKGSAGMVLSHVVHRFRTFYQKFRPVIVTINAQNLVRTSDQIHMALAEYLNKTEFSRCREIYKALKKGDGAINDFYYHHSREDAEVLRRLQNTSGSAIHWEHL